MERKGHHDQERKRAQRLHAPTLHCDATLPFHRYATLPSNRDAFLPPNRDASSHPTVTTHARCAPLRREGSGGGRRRRFDAVETRLHFGESPFDTALRL